MRSPLIAIVVATGAILIASALGCVSNPTYFPSTPAAIDSGDAGPLVMVVPYATETASEASARATLATSLGLMPDDVPTARRDDLELEVEWAIENLGTKDGIAELGATGANEFFRYDPDAFVTMDEDDDEAPPPLFTSPPIPVAAGTTATGIIREDQLGEAAQDLDAITRAGLPPTMVLFTRWPTGDVTGGVAPLPTIPSAAVAALLEVDLSLAADQHMRLTATLRVRDSTGRLRSPPSGSLVSPSSTDFTPPAEMP